MAKAYHIKHWDEDYENAETRKYANLHWYPKKTKLIGEGIGYTLAQENATHLLGMWYLIEALAATAPKGLRGWLIRNGTALTPERMFSLTRIDAKHFEEALKFFTQPQIGWLEFTEMPGSSPAKTPTPPASPDNAGRLPGDSPGDVPPETASPDNAGRKSLEEKNKTDRRVLRREERGAPGGPPGEVPNSNGQIPTEEDVRIWAIANEVDEAYAVDRFAATTEKNGWKANGEIIDWQKRFKRFWNEDKEAWLSKKNRRRPAAAPGGRPNGWKKGDQAWWWSDPISGIEAALNGALIAKQEKTAARLKEILKLRKEKS